MGDEILTELDSKGNQVEITSGTRYYLNEKMKIFLQHTNELFCVYDGMARQDSKRLLKSFANKI